MALVYVMNRMGEKRMFFYFVPATVIWGLFYYSGVHSTLSGVAHGAAHSHGSAFQQGILLP